MSDKFFSTGFAIHMDNLVQLDAAFKEMWEGALKDPRRIGAALGQKKCTCDIHSLMRNGCTCSGFAAEIKAKELRQDG